MYLKVIGCSIQHGIRINVQTVSLTVLPLEGTQTVSFKLADCSSFLASTAEISQTCTGILVECV